MNMKKTIAAAAAGAMAVSATATAASAATQPAIDTQGSFTYSLVKNFAVEKVGKATIVTENEFATPDTAISIYINLNDEGADAVFADDNGEGNLYIATNETDPKILYDADVKEGGDGRVDYTENAVIEISATGLMAGHTNNYKVRFTAEVDLSSASYDFDALDVQPGYKDADAVRDTFKATKIFAIGYSDAAEQTTFTAASTAGVENTRWKVTDYTKYDPAGLIVKAPLVSSTNTNRYDGGVPNIIAYLEGYNDNPTVNNYYVLEGIGNSFPVIGGGGVRTLKYVGRAEKYVDEIADAKDYINVMAVLNDTINNYDVTFTFATAAEPVWDSGKGGTTGVGDKDKGEFRGAYNADGNDIYTSFNQHLYGLYGNDSTYTPFYATNGNYFANPGINYNLFQGGLIVNDTYSMQLADTTIFSYSGSGLSFLMSDIEDNAIATYNSWLTYVQSLRLATSTEWYWDNLTITWATPVDDTVATGEGVGSDEVTLDDEPSAEDEVPVPDAEVEVPVAPNPATGNSAVALAVIPVALAAAAIVAKKRK